MKIQKKRIKNKTKKREKGGAKGVLYDCYNENTNRKRTGST